MRAVDCHRLPVQHGPGPSPEIDLTGGEVDPQEARIAELEAENAALTAELHEAQEALKVINYYSGKLLPSRTPNVS